MIFFVQYNLDTRAAAHHGQPRGEAEGPRDRRDDPPRGHQRGRRHQLQRLGVPDDLVIETTQLHPPIIRPLSSDLYFGSISLLISILWYFIADRKFKFLSFNGSLEVDSESYLSSAADSDIQTCKKCLTMFETVQYLEKAHNLLLE